MSSSSSEWASLSESDAESDVNSSEYEEPFTPLGTRRTNTTSVSDKSETPLSSLRSITALLAERESASGPTTPPQMINRKLASHFIPERGTAVARNHDRAYLGKWSADGHHFASAWQGSRVIMLHDHTQALQPRCVPNIVRCALPVALGCAVMALLTRCHLVDTPSHCRKTIHCRTLRWTVTDLAMTLDSRFLIYSTIAPVIHLASIEDTEAMSIANVTDIHESIYLGNEDAEYGEGVWSLRWSPSAKQILAGSSSSTYLVDIGTQKVCRRLRHHQDDINAVEYLDETGNVFFSGSDDSLIIGYDDRVSKPIGGFIGHLGGITYLDSDRSGRWLLSQSKDQSAKLWDIRTMSSFGTVKKERTMRDVPALLFDYRWQGPPRRGAAKVHPRDGSVVSYRGHAVLQTLIRAKFSPSGCHVYSGGSFLLLVYLYFLAISLACSRSRQGRHVGRCIFGIGFKVAIPFGCWRACMTMSSGTWSGTRLTQCWFRVASTG